MFFSNSGVLLKSLLGSARVLSLAIILVSTGVLIMGMSNSRAVDVSHPLRLFKVETAYDDVKFDVENSIVDAGYKIIYRGDIGKMLERTAGEVGSKKKVYEQAGFFLFCSAPHSYATMAADPRNIAFCPYNLIFYSLPGEKDTTYVGYRRPAPVGSEESKAALMKLDELLEGLVKAALN